VGVLVFDSKLSNDIDTQLTPELDNTHRPTFVSYIPGRSYDVSCRVVCLVLHWRCAGDVSNGDGRVWQRDSHDTTLPHAQCHAMHSLCQWHMDTGEHRTRELDSTRRLRRRW
jgi:hypothetical protein